jgi:hypothetical protein
LEQQQTCEFILELDPNSLILVEYSRDRYESEVYDQFTNQIEPMITNDYIGNYIFLVDPNPYHVNHVMLSSCDHYSEEEDLKICEDEQFSFGQKPIEINEDNLRLSDW